MARNRIKPMAAIVLAACVLLVLIRAIQDYRLRQEYGPVTADLVENGGTINPTGEKRVVAIQQEIDSNRSPSHDDCVFLSHILTGVEDPSTQADAIIALETAAENGLISSLDERYLSVATLPLLQSRDDRLRTKECSLLGNLNNKQVKPRLVPLLGDSDPAVKYEARRALARLGYSASS